MELNQKPEKWEEVLTLPPEIGPKLMLGEIFAMPSNMLHNVSFKVYKVIC